MNKKLILIISSLLLWQLPQEIPAQRFQGGLRAGITASEVSGDNLSGPNKLGFFGSVFTFTPLSEFSNLMLEVMYIQKGSRSIPNEKNDFNEYKLYLQYAEIPVTFHWDISPYTDLIFLEKLTINTGLSASFLVNYSESVMGAPVPPEERQDFFPAELNIILGIAFPVSQSLDFTFGFSNSLTPIRPHSGGGKVWYNRGQYNSLWSFGLSYVFW